MKVLTMIAFAVLAAISSSFALQAGGGRSKGAPEFKPEAEVHDIMELNQDLNDSLRAQLGAEPDWKKAAHISRLLAEVANILQYHHPTSETKWWESAGAFRDGARAVNAAVRSEDIAQARQAVKNMLQSCKQCHDVYKQ